MSTEIYRKRQKLYCIRELLYMRIQYVNNTCDDSKELTYHIVLALVETAVPVGEAVVVGMPIHLQALKN